MTLREKLSQDYATIFKKSWPAWVGGLSIGFLNVFLFIFYQPWTTLDGVLNWGGWTMGNLLGLVRPADLSPILRSGSVINVGLLLGAFFSALLAGQFGIRIGSNRELLKGAIGGVLIGTGAAVVRGCNIGGFFSGTSALSLHGLGMAVGLAIGAFLGARIIVWEMEKLPSTPVSSSKRYSVLLANQKVQPYVGLLVLIGLVIGAIIYLQGGYTNLALILLAGAVLGVVSQRSRVCFVRAFREPFLTGHTDHTKAMLLGLLVSVIGFAIVKYMAQEQWLVDLNDDFVRPTFWIGSLVGGLIFGVGMVIAGGCGGGTIWRVGEGHIKLWVALAGYIISAALVDQWLRSTGLLDKLGQAVFLPDAVGSWTWAVVIIFGILLIWYILSQWNESTGKLTAF